MPKFRKRSADVEAVQWTGDMAPVIGLVGHDLPTYGEGRDGSLRVAKHECRLGDWIVKDVYGGVYRCRPETFDIIFEPSQ